MEILLMLLFGGWVFSALIGYMIGQPKNQGAAGLLFGLLLGPLGWLITFMLSDQNPKCPTCFARINPSVPKCWRCGLDLEANRQAWAAYHSQSQHAPLVNVSPAPPVDPARPYGELTIN